MATCYRWISASRNSASKKRTYPVAWDLVHFQGHIWGLVRKSELGGVFYQHQYLHWRRRRRRSDEVGRCSSPIHQMEGDTLVQAGIIPWAQGVTIRPGGSRLLGARSSVPASLTTIRGPETINRPEYLSLARLVSEVSSLRHGRP